MLIGGIAGLNTATFKLNVSNINMTIRPKGKNEAIKLSTFVKLMVPPCSMPVPPCH